jgi:TonB family protein
VPRCLSILLVLNLALAQQQGQRPRDVYRAGTGIKPPKLVHKEQARYTREAFNARIQGKVVCEVIVDERGAPVYISVISPLGFGLDESAQASISRWKFEPGTKDDRPVKVVTMVEVSFRFPGTWFDSKAERRRTDFNVAVTNLRRRDRNLAEQAAKTIEELARQKYPPAMYILARLHFSGELVEKNPAQALALMEASAEKGHAPAMCDLGMLYFEGIEVSRDTQKGLQLLSDSAVLGSADAQAFLGAKYEAGDVVPRELDRARRYFRQCASTGHPVCQFHLAKLMFEAPERKEWEYLQAITWFQLAADRGMVEARKVVEAELQKLTPEQIAWTKRLKSQLLRRR